VAEKSNRIRLFNFALGATTREVHAIKQAHHACLSMKWSSPAPVQGKTVSIEVQTLEEICKKNEIQTIDFLKIDTEGWELEVLRGAENFITEGKIKLVLCEVGFSAKDQMHTPLSELMIFMEKYGYSLFALYDHCYWEGSLNFANALFVSESTKKSMKKVCHENFWKTLV
jgi:FkbM family methyltransferase